MSASLTACFCLLMVVMQAQRFLALVLLPKVRQDIEDNKRCHFALFQAMKKATYKPDAFFKVHSVLCCYYHAVKAEHVFQPSIKRI